jgi:hypothetical protein
MPSLVTARGKLAMEKYGEHRAFGYAFVETCGCEYERPFAATCTQISAVKRTAVRIWRMALVSIAVVGDVRDSRHIHDLAGIPYDASENW